MRMNQISQRILTTLYIKAPADSSRGCGERVNSETAFEPQDTGQEPEARKDCEEHR